MNTSNVFIKALFLAIAASLQTVLSNQDTVYESVKEICKTCTCLSQLNDESSSGNIKHFILSCSTKNVQHILPTWPEEFGANITSDVEIIATYSGNPIRSLQQLPETDAAISFSCRHCELKEIASAAFIDTINILRLDLSWNKLNGAALHPDVFRGRYSDKEYNPIGIQDLDLSHNEIESFESKTFEHLQHLKRLNLAYNRFGDLERSKIAIGSIQSIEFLDLSYNTLENLPSVMFKDLNNLKEIWLDGNQFKRVPLSLSGVGRSLELLSIGNNPIREVNEGSFLGLKRLSYLNISSMPLLSDVDVGTFTHLDNLQVLLCNNNTKLTKFDLASLMENRNLKEFDISRCNLTEFTTGDPDSESINENSTIKWSKLRLLKLSSNPWYCDCHFVKLLKDFEKIGNKEIYYDHEVRCASPYYFAGVLPRELNYEEICHPPVHRKHLKIPIHEPTVRPRQVALSIIAVSFVVILGLISGYLIVFVKQKLKKNKFGFTQPIRYTTVRNSTISVE